jgi:hypothetical protein
VFGEMITEQFHEARMTGHDPDVADRAVLELAGITASPGVGPRSSSYGRGTAEVELAPFAVGVGQRQVGVPQSTTSEGRMPA